MGGRGGCAQVGDDFEECVLNCGLGDSNVGDVGLETADSPRKGKCGQLGLEGDILQSSFAGEGCFSGGLFK